MKRTMYEIKEHQLTACLLHVFVVFGFAAALVVVASVPVALLDPAFPPCEINTQFPKPPAVVNETRQLAPSLPPVHFVPDGRVPETCTVPVDEGARTPFFVIETEPPVNDLPVPAVSMSVEAIWVEPSLPLIGKTSCQIKVKRT